MNWEIFDSWAVREGVLAVTPAVKQEWSMAFLVVPIYKCKVWALFLHPWYSTIHNPATHWQPVLVIQFFVELLHEAETKDFSNNWKMIVSECSGRKKSGNLMRALQLTTGWCMDCTWYCGTHQVQSWLHVDCHCWPCSQ
jgi:hypothetical protein